MVVLGAHFEAGTVVIEGGLAILGTVYIGAATLLLALRASPAGPPGPATKLSGSRSLAPSVLVRYYDQETPIPVPGLPPILQTSLFDFSSSPVSPDRVKFTIQRGRVYRLPPTLETLGVRVSDAYRRLGVEYKADDRIGIVTGVQAQHQGLKIRLISGRMLDEYTTIQNPEMDYEALCPTQSGAVEPKSVRAMFAVPSNSNPNGHRFARLDARTHVPSEPIPGYRLAAHVILLFAGPGVPWQDRGFFLQLRASRRLAIGAGEITSSMGSGIDYRDAASFRASLRSAFSGHSPFTNYVLRELRYEVLIQPDEVTQMHLFGIARDMERLGQPVAILLGETSLSFAEVNHRWVQADENPLKFGNVLQGGAGREHWEAQNLLYRKISDIPALLADPNVQSSTKTCLHYLQAPGTAASWDKLPRFAAP